MRAVDLVVDLTADRDCFAEHLVLQIFTSTVVATLVSRGASFARFVYLPAVVLCMLFPSETSFGARSRAKGGKRSLLNVSGALPEVDIPLEHRAQNIRFLRRIVFCASTVFVFTLIRTVSS